MPGQNHLMASTFDHAVSHFHHLSYLISYKAATTKRMFLVSHLLNNNVLSDTRQMFKHQGASFILPTWTINNLQCNLLHDGCLYQPYLESQ